MPHAVIDASVVIRSALKLEKYRDSDRVLEHYQPVLLDHALLECGNTFRRYVKARQITAEKGGAILRTLHESYTFLPATQFVDSAFELSTAHDHALYDCLYIALAIESNAPLATADKKLCRKFEDLTGLRLINLYDMPETLP